MNNRNLALRRAVVGVVAAAGMVIASAGTSAHAAHAAGNCGSTIVDWVPDIGHPVSWGFDDLNVDHGAPRNMRIYYPSDSLPPGYQAPMLQSCLGRYPVVLFLPGEQPWGLFSSAYYTKWDSFGSVLARSGYVVVVPDYNGALPDVNYAGAVQAAMADIAFVQTAWSGSDYVDSRASVTTVGGHSNGALLAARVAAANPNFGAYFSLSGRFHVLPDPEPAASVGGMPSFFMWEKSETRGTSTSDLDVDKLWNNLQQNRYAVRYGGEHFDYLPYGQTGTYPVGKCQLTLGDFAGDLVALFVAKFVIGHTKVYDGLGLPSLELTEEQKTFSYGQGHLWNEWLYSLCGAGAKADVEWWIFDTHGSRTVA
jgi:hypothetical protein